MSAFIATSPEDIKTREELIEDAYRVMGYRPSADACVINDRYNALEKLSNDQLKKIINLNK